MSTINTFLAAYAGYLHLGIIVIVALTLPVLMMWVNVKITAKIVRAISLGLSDDKDRQFWVGAALHVIGMLTIYPLVFIVILILDALVFVTLLQFF